jgi:hypothetical protein
LLKPLAYSVVIAMSLSACSFSRQASQAENHPANLIQQKQTVKFLEDISVNPSASRSAKNLPGIQGLKEVRDVRINPFNPGLYILNNIENSNWLQFKYSIIMQVAVEELQNIRLLTFIDDWYSTRYRYGGSSKRGIDCSAFTAGLLSEVFNVSLPRTCREQYHATERIRRTELQEGDLVFFNIRKGISHVGVYLRNNKFVHASSSSGVMISDLHESYFGKRFAGAGRVINALAAATSIP